MHVPVVFRHLVIRENVLEEKKGGQKMGIKDRNRKTRLRKMKHDRKEEPIIAQQQTEGAPSAQRSTR